MKASDLDLNNILDLATIDAGSLDLVDPLHQAAAHVLGLARLAQAGLAGGLDPQEHPGEAGLDHGGDEGFEDLHRLWWDVRLGSYQCGGPGVAEHHQGEPC